ncbi:MAG: SIMPL domain-containing protein [Streptosporangiaceae bacterium]
MDGQPVISVRGEALLEVEPEVAIMTVTIEARDRDRRTVLGRLASRNQHVTGLIKSHGEAVEKVESGPASVRPDIRDKKSGSERVAGYLGRASVRITVRDFTILGELVTSLSEEDLVTVAGPWWALRPDSPVYRDARLAAARDAMVRAREYAEAFGGDVAGLIEAADTGLLTSPGEHGPRFRATSASRAVGFAGQAPQAELDFEPARQTVTAQVEARFAMTMPTR